MKAQLEKNFIQQAADAWKAEYAQYLKAKSVLEAIQERVDEAKATLIMACEGEPFEGCGIKLTVSQVKGSIQYELIPQLKDVDLDIYRKPSQERWTVKPSVVQ